MENLMQCICSYARLVPTYIQTSFLFSLIQSTSRQSVTYLQHLQGFALSQHPLPAWISSLNLCLSLMPLQEILTLHSSISQA